MLALKLICVGRMKEPYYRDAFAEYQKRLGAFCRFETVALAEQRAGHGSDPTEREIAAALVRDAVEFEILSPAG
ncbi:MAG: 23S rRNA (pseudouridine(1915)-N(3))-methyltransferase RlmH, partial [Oscillospiraceae bacterium]|nr:23S rRNA (pseudouridine(1915)-N(3))-methyltransferase RlmH [Oscillospiraceae bacterium]